MTKTNTKVQHESTPEVEEPETTPEVEQSVILGPKFEIERGIPVPNSRGAPSSNPYPFERMAAGDSLFIEKPDNTVNISNIKSMAEKKCPGTKWTTRKMEGGFRIWRTA